MSSIESRDSRNDVDMVARDNAIRCMVGVIQCEFRNHMHEICFSGKRTRCSCSSSTARANAKVKAVRSGNSRRLGYLYSAWCEP